MAIKLLLILISNFSFGLYDSEFVQSELSSYNCPTKIPSDVTGVDFVTTNGTHTVSLVSLKRAEEAFEYTTHPGLNIPFSVPEDGCYARAHKMTMELEKSGIYTAKLFVSGKLSVKTDNSPEGQVDWYFHVAPVLCVKNNDKNELMILDPSIFTKPVTIETWLRKQTLKEATFIKKIYVATKYSYRLGDVFSLIDYYASSDIADMDKVLKNNLKIEKHRKGLN